MKELCRAVYFFDFLPDTSEKRAEKCLKSAKKAQKRPKTLDFSLIFMF